jgi:hypothetical protein
MQVITEETQLRGGGHLILDSVNSLDFNFAESHFSLNELGRVIGKDIDGQFDFSGDVNGTFSHLQGTAEVDGVLFERGLGPFTTEFDFENGILELSDLSGRAFDGSLRGSVRIDFVARPETFDADLLVRNLNLNRIVPNTFSSDLNGSVGIRGSGMGSNSFMMDLDLELDQGQFDFVEFDSLNSVVTVNVDNLYFHRGARLFYKNSSFAATGILDYEGELMLLGGFKTDQLADFWGDLFIRELSGAAAGDFVVSGPVTDPNIRGSFEGDSCSFYGFATDTIHAEFDIESFLFSRRGTVEMKSWQSSIWGLPADSVIGRIEIDSHLVTINLAEAYDEQTYYHTTGLVTLHDSTATAELDSFLLRLDTLEFTAAEPVVEFTADGIVIEQTRISGAGTELQLAVDYGYDSTIRILARTDTLPISPWLQLLHVDSSWQGRLSFEGELDGTLAEPLMTLSATTDDLSYGETSIGDLNAQLSYAKNQLLVEELTLRRPGGDAELKGILPLSFRLDSLAMTTPDEQMDFALHSEGSDLSLFRIAVPDLEYLTGDYQLELDVAGTPGNLRSVGSFELKNGSAKVYQLENPIENIQAEIYSDDRQIMVDWVEGKMSYEDKTGTVMATGEVTVLESGELDYDLVARGEKVPIKYDLGDIYGLCDLNYIEITGHDPPQVRGDVVIYEARYFDEFQHETVLAAREAADTTAYLDYVVNLDFMPASIKVRNSDLNAVLDGNLTVVREGTQDNFIGVLNVVRGKYYLLDMTFEIEEGSRIIFDNIEQPNPSLNVRVSTKVRTFAGSETGASYSELDLVIGGTLLQPSINPAGGSPYSTEDIASLLVLNSPASAAEAGIESTPLEQRLLDFAGVSIGQKLTHVIGVERFEITPVYGSDRELTGAEVLLGVYATPNLYTYLASPLGFEQSAEVGFEYRFGRHIFIGGRRDRENLYHLNLNLNWTFE